MAEPRSNVELVTGGVMEFEISAPFFAGQARSRRLFITSCGTVCPSQLLLRVVPLFFLFGPSFCDESKRRVALGLGFSLPRCAQCDSI